MIENRYAVIKASLDDTNETLKSFRIWHNTYDEAREEAKRLCQKEHCQFVIIRAISKCNIGNLPVEWIEFRTQTSEKLRNIRNRPRP